MGIAHQINTGETDESAVQDCAKAIAAEKAAIAWMAADLLTKIAEMNCPPQPIHLWRCALQQTYERLPEVVGE